ncbi:hypothetical protein BDC45DRAFT_473150 [Circinella umbellata]|nr:hypothetical protein BDC45DRAFT_473150 [Circinella umbellata]
MNLSTIIISITTMKISTTIISITIISITTPGSLMLKMQRESWKRLSRRRRMNLIFCVKS